jgi:nucleoside-diphosphate-sugar epimerase
MGDSICITGASGFLGTRLLDRLQRSGRKLACLGRRKPIAASGKVEFIEGDLLDRGTVRRAVEGCGTVVHLAAVTGKQSPGEYFRVNRDGTEVLASEARRAGVGRFLYISTIAVKFPDISRYHYAQSKQQAEAIVAASGLPWTIIRPTMIFGPGSPVFEGLKRLASLPVVPIFGNGRARVQPVFVGDLASVIATLAEADEFAGRTIEVGGPDVLSIGQLLLRIRNAAGIPNGRVIHLPVGPIAACLSLLEPMMRQLLPVTAGQLASFTSDGTAAPDPCVARWQAGMRGVEEMLRATAKERAGSA